MPNTIRHLPDPTSPASVAEQEETPRDFNSLHALIVARRDKLPKRLVQVADFAIAHPQEIAFGRVADLAIQAGVQPSTLVRFSQALGYSGFSDLQAVFRAHARQRWPDYRERLEHLGDNTAEASNDPHGLMGEFVHAAHVSLDHLMQTVEARSLAAAVSMLTDARSVSVIGTRRVYPAVLYLVYALRKLGLRCDLVDNAGGLGRRQVELLGPGDVVVSISYTPYAAETIDMSAAAKRGGVQVLGITDSPFSPLTSIADTWLEVAETDHAGFRSLSATFVLATTLAVAVAKRRVPIPAA